MPAPRTMSSIPPPDTWRWLLRLFGPPRVKLREAYVDDGAAGTFDHGSFDDLLQRCVDPDGFVDYGGLARYSGILDGYLSRVATADYGALSRDEKLAFAINVYNAATLRLVVDHMPIASIRDIPSRARWRDRRWTVGGRRLSLEDIENRELRAKFADPRIHFAINCASVGCPKLRAAAFTGPRIDAELDGHTRDVHRGERWARLESGSIWLTRVYRWYEGDFVQAAGSIRDYAQRYTPDGLPVHRVRWLPYDWSLNAA